MIELDYNELKKKKLFIATPMYGGQCSGLYTKASCDLAVLCAENGIEIEQYYLLNESLITRARNYCVDSFLRSDYTHIMFIDSDIGFRANDALSLLQLCDSDKGYDIVIGPYPKKTIAWEKVKSAVERGFSDEDPNLLENFVGDYAFNPIEGSFSIKEPVEIKEGGTGFMVIDRKALEKYALAYPELKYVPDHRRNKNFDGSNEITAFFDTVIDPNSKRYLSEDYMFSQYARDIGLKIWMAPWINLRHIGNYTFLGNMSAIAAIQASPTVSKESMPKKSLTNLNKNAIKESTSNLNRQQRRAMKKGK